MAKVARIAGATTTGERACGNVGIRGACRARSTTVSKPALINERDIHLFHLYLSLYSLFALLLFELVFAANIFVFVVYYAAVLVVCLLYPQYRNQSPWGFPNLHRPTILEYEPALPGHFGKLCWCMSC